MAAARKDFLSLDAPIWWGPITREKQAREIIAWAAWAFLLIGLAPLAGVATAALRGELSLASPIYANFGQNWLALGQVGLAVVEVAASVALLKTRHPAAAILLFVCCVGVIGWSMGVDLGRVADGALSLVQGVILETCLVLLARLNWRAMDAARALKQLRTLEHFS
jgi:hypothetical protein